MSLRKLSLIVLVAAVVAAAWMTPIAAQQGQGRGAGGGQPQAAGPAPAWPPLHVYLRVGIKSHGPGQHDYPQFIADWSNMLTEQRRHRGRRISFPDDGGARGRDVIVMYKGDAGYMTADERSDARGVHQARRRAGQFPRHALRRRSAVPASISAGQRSTAK